MPAIQLFFSSARKEEETEKEKEEARERRRSSVKVRPKRKIMGVCVREALVQGDWRRTVFWMEHDTRKSKFSILLLQNTLFRIVTFYNCSNNTVITKETSIPRGID